MDFDDNILISGFENSNIGLFTINDVKLVKNLSGHSAGITGIKLNAQVFASSSYDGSVRLWSTKGDNLAVFEEPNELLRNEMIDFFFKFSGKSHYLHNLKILKIYISKDFRNCPKPIGKLLNQGNPAKQPET